MKFKPSWVPLETSKLVAWLITTHDLFGRFLRGLTEKTSNLIERNQNRSNFTKTCDDDDARDARDPFSETSYGGALDHWEVCKRLKKSFLPFPISVLLHTTLWKADLCSLPSLNWLLPVIPLVVELVRLLQ
eukprot:TRINITY_DN4559_c0_g1_i9.p2 TRINITY_DN4559_c0_g1~~TRINITY_DN4559_c0_g1_i9.p2  ORF type:complete len:131 (+),score=30.04 TRINITY_DN4559_c0_g1_i9:675-1067(+)